MSKNRDLFSVSLSGINAKRRIVQCSNQNTLFECYLGKKFLLGKGCYIKISGDPLQPVKLCIDENGYSYSYDDGRITTGTFSKGNYDDIDNIIKHYNSNGVLISESKRIFLKKNNTSRIGITQGTAYSPGKFDKYLGDYTAIHKYIYNSTGIVNYINKYSFTSGEVSEALYSKI